MKGVRYVAELDHLRHVLNILACLAHVKRLVAREVGPPSSFGPPPLVPAVGADWIAVGRWSGRGYVDLRGVLLKAIDLAGGEEKLSSYGFVLC